MLKHLHHLNPPERSFEEKNASRLRNVNRRDCRAVGQFLGAQPQENQPSENVRQPEHHLPEVRTGDRAAGNQAREFRGDDLPGMQ